MCARRRRSTYHLDVLLFVLFDVFNVDVVGFHLRELLVRGRDDGKERLDAC